jgi:hypothetical protein
MGSIETNIFDNRIFPATYSIGDVSEGAIIDNAKWTDIYNKVNSERSRRGKSSISNPGFSGKIQASDLNALVSGINSAGYTSGFSGVSTNIEVDASHINATIDKLQASGALCICNTNYCTCNCNYCTCNCNYSCTCNCNYSDKRLKRNIKFIKTINGLNVYSYNYIWDKVRHVGVMAQEILKTNFSSAVKVDSRGYFMVDYSKLPINLKGL